MVCVCHRCGQFAYGTHKPYLTGCSNEAEINSNITALLHVDSWLALSLQAGCLTHTRLDLPSFQCHFSHARLGIIMLISFFDRDLFGMACGVSLPVADKRRATNS